MAMPKVRNWAGAGDLEVAGSKGVMELFNLQPGQCACGPSFDVR